MKDNDIIQELREALEYITTYHLDDVHNAAGVLVGLQIGAKSVLLRLKDYLGERP